MCILSFLKSKFLHSLYITQITFYFNLNINCPISNFPIDLLRSQILRIDIGENLLFLRFILLRRFPFSLNDLFEFTCKFALSLLQFKFLFIESSFPLCQCRFPLLNLCFTKSKFTFLLSRKFLYHCVDISWTFVNFLCKLIHLNFLLKLFSERIMLLAM